MSAGPQFYIYHCLSADSSYTLLANASDTTALVHQLDALQDRAVLVIFAETQPRDLLVRRIRPMRYQMLMCPATDILLRQNPENPHLRGNSVSFVQLAPGERGPDRMFPWFHYANVEVIGGGQDVLEEPSIQACSDPEKAFLYNVMNDPERRHQLCESGIQSWADFYAHYDKLALSQALWIAAIVKRSLNRWAYMASEQNSSTQYLAEVAIRVASAVAPWQSQDPPTSDVRTMNALNAGNIRSVGDIGQCNPARLTKLSNFGRKSLTLLVNNLLDLQVETDAYSANLAV